MNVLEENEIWIVEYLVTFSGEKSWAWWRWNEFFINRDAAEITAKKLQNDYEVRIRKFVPEQ